MTHHIGKPTQGGSMDLVFFNVILYFHKVRILTAPTYDTVQFIVTGKRYSNEYKSKTKLSE